jgi:hypothetical protein
MFGITGGEIFGFATGITGLLGLLKVRLHLPGARLEALRNQIMVLEDEIRDAMEHGVKIVSAWFEDIARCVKPNEPVHIISNLNSGLEQGTRRK